MNAASVAIHIPGKILLTLIDDDLVYGELDLNQTLNHRANRDKITLLFIRSIDSQTVFSAQAINQKIRGKLLTFDEGSTNTIYLLNSLQENLRYKLEGNSKVELIYVDEDVRIAQALQEKLMLIQQSRGSRGYVFAKKQFTVKYCDVSEYNKYSQKFADAVKSEFIRLKQQP